MMEKSEQSVRRNLRGEQREDGDTVTQRPEDKDLTDLSVLH